MPAIDRRWLFVFSHPNHEIAVFGLMQRLRPWTVFLTDGGGPSRVAATRASLERLGLLDRARFLDWPEPAFYEALVGQDMAFWRELVDEVAASVRSVGPDAVAADAIEFYNPVHDMSLPITVAALRAAGGEAELHEVPLVREAAEPGVYALQNPLAPPSEAILLSDAEWDLKWDTWMTVHRGQLYGLAPLVAEAGRAGLERETLHAARDCLRRPGAGERLRYEARGRLLREQGEIEEVITLDGHVHPVVRALLAEPTVS